MSFKLMHKPIKTTTITSPFGWRIHPITATRSMHNGIDLSDGRDRDNIYSVAPGMVIQAGYNSSAGNNVRIDHGAGVITWYMHMNDLLVKVGDQVRAGTVIGHEGTTGASTGDHLHFQININGTAVDPLPYLKEIWTNPNPTPEPEKPKEPKKTLDTVASEVRSGVYGNDPARKRALQALGYTDAEITEIYRLVNKWYTDQNKPAEPASEPIPPEPMPAPNNPTPETVVAGVKVILNNPVNSKGTVLDSWIEGARFITIEKSAADGTVAISRNGKSPATARVYLKDITIV